MDGDFGSTASGARPVPGLRLGRYRLGVKIGEGGMGVVHMGVDDAGSAVAVKVLRPHVAGDPEARRRLAREVETLRRVRHARVAEVLDADPDGETPYVVTQYVPGMALDDHVRAHGPLRGVELARLGDGLGQALAAIHAAGVVHRDLKPGNVLMLDGDPVVIDFGIAHVADDVRLTSTGLVMGTPGYLSPELVVGGAVTEATDWWGWAATTAFAATGRPPFGRGPMEVVLDRVRRADADLDGVPAALLGVVRAGLAVDPAERPAPSRLRVATAELARRAAAGVPDDDAVMPFLRTGSAAPTPDVEGPTQVVEGPTQVVEPATQVVDGPTQVVAPPPARAPQTPRTPQTRPMPVSAATTPVPQPVSYTAPPPHAWPPPAQHVPPPAAAPPWGRPVHWATPVPPAGYASPQPVPSVAPAAGPAGRRPLVGVLVLLVTAAVAAVVPLVAAALWTVALVALRTTDRATGAMLRRRYERGVRRSDGARVVAGLPGHALMAVLVTLAASVLPLALGVSTAFVVGLVSPSGPAPGESIPLFAGALVATITATWGPGSGSVRRGARVVGRRALAGSTARSVLSGVLVVVLVAAVAAAWSRGLLPDWTPLDGPPLTSTTFGGTP